MALASPSSADPPSFLRFTSYDFKQMQRRSYYPHNQQLISTATATSSGLASSRPATPADGLRVDHSIRINSTSLEYNNGDVDPARVEKFNEKELS
jgi:serine/threonine kinase 32